MALLSELEPADRHRRIAGDFGRIVELVRDWDAPSPVAEWVARDIVEHLVGWSTGFLAAGTVQLRPQAADSTPTALWSQHRHAIQQLLDEPATAGKDFVHPAVGPLPLEMAIDRFYTSDMFMHTWDLAEAARLDHGLEHQFASNLLEGMRIHETVLRTSGHYGPAVAVDPAADPVTRLMGFIGRDPEWRGRQIKPS